MSIQLIEGDILSPAAPGEAVCICQQVNCQGRMGGGLVKQIRERFPVVLHEYRAYCQARRPETLLGAVQFVPVGRTGKLLVANLFGQLRGGKDEQTDYDAFRQALRGVTDLPPEYTIRIPYRIGCSVGGGDWDAVSALIDEMLAGRRVEIWRRHLNVVQARAG